MILNLKQHSKVDTVPKSVPKTFPLSLSLRLF